MDNKSSADRKELLEWLESKKGEVFDFREEMHRYCSNDVTILRKAALTFRKLMLGISGVDPFQYATIASVCMAVFKSSFYTETWEGSRQDQQDDVVRRGRVPRKETFTLKAGVFYDSRGEEVEEDVVNKRFIRAPLAQSDHTPNDNFSAKSIHWLRYVITR